MFAPNPPALSPLPPLPHDELGQISMDKLHALGLQNAPLRFDAFMQAALYHPHWGYYSRGEAIFGAQGDFVTAPEISPLFGQTLGAALRDTVRQTGGTVYEFGAGRGKLAAQLLQAAGEHISRYCIVDVSGGLKGVQSETVNRLAPAHAHKLEFLSDLPPVLSGVVIGNEVLDAMPVRVFRWHRGAVYERFVQADPLPTGGAADAEPVCALRWLDLPADEALSHTVHALQAAHGPWPDDYISEVNEQAPAFIRTLTERLDGVALMIDYGFCATEYFHPQRATGTLVAHERHTMHANVLKHPGQLDLTAHVDFTACYEALEAIGGELLGYASQGAFLLHAGLLSQGLALVDSPMGIEQRRAVQWLTAEHEMGELFKVLVWGKGQGLVPTDLHHLLWDCDRSHQL